MKLAQKRSTGTLRSCPEESVNFDDTKNLYIEGDNLEVLKLLQTSYYRKVKMIYIDQTIKAGDEFFIGLHGEKKKKAALGDLKEVCLPSFLLGVWHYVVLNRRDNSVGKITYDEWCPSNDRAPRKYTAHMGEGILEDLTTYTVDTKETIAAEIVDEPIEDGSSDAAGQDGTPVSQQMVNNNPTFFNINISGGNNNFFHHVDKLTINNGGKQDE